MPRVTYPLRLLAHDLRDPANIGSLFRLADALGVERVHLRGTCPVPPSTKIRRTSRSTDVIVPFDYAEDPVPIAQALCEAGYRLFALEPTETSQPLPEVEVAVSDRVCLLLGGERTGVREDLLRLAERTVHIPMLGENASMNVAMAAAIAVYHFGQRLTVLSESE